MSTPYRYAKSTAILGFLASFAVGAVSVRVADGRGFVMPQIRKQPAAAEAKAEPNASPQSPATRPGAVRADLYVMSQCPFGVQAENAFKDVVAKFGKELDLRVEFIGNTTASGELASLHGPTEVKGDALQICAQKYAPEKSFDFILCQNENMKEVATNGEACATKLGMPVEKILACADGPEGKSLLTASFLRAKQAGAQGSPTMVFEGRKYEGGRKPMDLIKAICNAATGKRPAACADIPESPPVNVTLLTDSRCGADCDAKRFEGTVRGKIAKPVLSIADYGTAEGKKVFDRIKPATLPAFVFDKTIDADKDALEAFARGMREQDGTKAFSAGNWNPLCADEGGCELDACKPTMQCRKELPSRLDVFVMSQCPFGVKGLDAMKEVLDNFKKSGIAVDFAVHFIGDGDEKSLSSMHGQAEVDEDVREVCAIHHYPKNAKYMEYIWCRNKSIRDPNWQACTGGSTGIDTAVMQKCYEGEEGKRLLAASFAVSKAAGMTASPTWLANNKFKFSGVDAEKIKSNLCAHNKLPGCENTLSGKPASAPGAKEPGCGPG
jgi:predicted DsbA family dithiol-disulfide isomerase